MLLTLSIIFFSLGILFNIIPRIWKDIRTFKFFVTIGIIISLGFIWTIADTPGQDSGALGFISFQVMEYIMISALLIVGVFLDRFLPTINVMVLVVNTILFWYLQLVHQFLPMKFLAIPIIFSGLVVVVSLKAWKLPKPVKFLLFIWNLLILLSIFLLYVFTQGWELLNVPETAYGYATATFFFGMLYMNFLMNIVPIISLIVGKRVGDLEIDAAKSMVNKFTDEKLSFQTLGLIILVSVSVLGINLAFGLISDILLVNMIAVILPLILSFMGSLSHKHAAVTIEKR